MSPRIRSQGKEIVQVHLAGKIIKGKTIDFRPQVLLQATEVIKSSVSPGGPGR